MADALIDAAMTTEHAYLELERLAVLADEPVRGKFAKNHREEIEFALQAPPTDTIAFG